MSGLMSIYNHSPIFLQNVLTTLQGYHLKRIRFGKDYRLALKEYTSRDYSDESSLRAYQNERFVELVQYAFNNSPFYRDYYRDVNWSEINSADDIAKLPILPKETVRQNIERMYTVDAKHARISNTSGTSGTSMCFRYLPHESARRLAYLDAFKIRHGFIPMKMKRASFNSAKIVPLDQSKKVFWRTNLSIRQKIYSGYHCKGDNIPYYIRDLNRYQPQSIDGYPSAIYEIAKYILDHNVELTFRPIAIFPTAETLLPHYRAAIEKAFGCPVHDQYASSEGAPFITDCSCGNLHYCMDTGIIEFSEDGEMIVTCFETHGTPLIRYQIGDRAFLAEKQTCPCGCVMPVVSRIEGRTGDFIYSRKNGKFTSVYLSLVSQEFDNSVKMMQFVQDSPDSVEVRLVTDDRYTPGMNQIILDKLHYSLGEDMKIEIKKVPELERDPSGKFRLIINRLDNYADL